MVSAGLTGEAPYTDVLTHGWVLDAQGRAMHKSVGNVIEPAEVVKRFGADVIRWWALATDWRTDVRVGDEILQRVAEAYRKVRNTFRFLLGNLSDFDPAAALPRAELTGVDRAFSDLLAARVHEMREEYARLEFHRALDTLLNVCTVDLSAVYLDAAKDRLYTLAASDSRRRSAQTVLWQALQDLVIAASPALVFTADEVWQHHPALIAAGPSVHLAQWPQRPAGDVTDWERLVRVRDAVNAAIEPLRAAKSLASPAEADVTLAARPALVEALPRFRDELAGFLLVARISVRAAGAGELDDEQEMVVQVSRTAWPKCERCWTFREDVAPPDGQNAGLCAKCVEAMAAQPIATPEASGGAG